MKNLLLNSTWEEVYDNMPEFYTIDNSITYDHFELNGYYTCSLTLDRNESSELEYDLYIDVSEFSFLLFGLIIRAINLDKLYFIISFFDYNKKFIYSEKHDVTTQIYHEFANVYTQFVIPDTACYIKANIVYEGMVTACTFCLPGIYAM